MKRYLIKEISTGTESNPNFAGVVNIAYLAAGHNTKCYCSIFDYEFSSEERRNFAIKHLAREYGYKSISACKRALAIETKRCQAESDRFNYHTFKLEPIEVEI
jgi:hypothetical protein